MENTNISSSTKSSGLYFVIPQPMQKSDTSKDVDDFIGELLTKDSTLENELRNARKLVADVLYDEQPVSLKVLRLRAGYSQAQLAEKINMKQPNICELEAGKRKPSIDTLIKLAAALETTTAVILQSIKQSE